MIDYRQIATLGLSPGFSTFHCATLGHYFGIVVTVRPSGGSDLEVTEIRDSRRLVTVEVFYKTRRWKQSLLVETIVIDKVIQVISTIKSVKERLIAVNSSLITHLKQSARTTINKTKNQGI